VPIVADPFQHVNKYQTIVDRYPIAWDYGTICRAL